MKHTGKLLATEVGKGRSIWIAAEQDIEGYMVYDHIRKHSYVCIPLYTVSHTQTRKHWDAPPSDLFVLLVQWTEAMEVVTV